MDLKNNPEGIFAFLAGIGAVIGIGRLLAEDGPVTFRIAAGRALVSGGLGASAGVIFSLFPDANPVLLYGTAAGLASLGTSGVENLVLRILRKD